MNGSTPPAMPPFFKPPADPLPQAIEAPPGLICPLTKKVFKDPLTVIPCFCSFESEVFLTTVDLSAEQCPSCKKKYIAAPFNKDLRELAKEWEKTVQRIQEYQNCQKLSDELAKKGISARQQPQPAMQSATLHAPVPHDGLPQNITAQNPALANGKPVAPQLSPPPFPFPKSFILKAGENPFGLLPSNPANKQAATVSTQPLPPPPIPAKRSAPQVPRIPIAGVAVGAMPFPPGTVNPAALQGARPATPQPGMPIVRLEDAAKAAAAMGYAQSAQRMASGYYALPQQGAPRPSTVTAATLKPEQIAAMRQAQLQRAQAKAGAKPPAAIAQVPQQNIKTAHNDRLWEAMQKNAKSTADNGNLEQTVSTLIQMGSQFPFLKSDQYRPEYEKVLAEYQTLLKQKLEAEKAVLPPSQTPVEPKRKTSDNEAQAPELKKAKSENNEQNSTAWPANQTAVITLPTRQDDKDGESDEEDPPLTLDDN